MRRACETFQWIGQALYCCDRCGHPYWDHRLEPVAGGYGMTQLITPERAKAVRQTWEPAMKAKGYQVPA